MSSISSEEIISVLKSEIENYELETKGQEVGTVIWIGDGIATVYGLDHAMYGEIVVFDTGVKGMVQDIKRNEIGIILLGKDTGLKEGSKVSRTKKKAGIPVSDAYIGRVIDALGAPIDGKGSIDADDYRPIENDAPGIVGNPATGNRYFNNRLHVPDWTWTERINHRRQTDRKDVYRNRCNH